MADFPNQNDFMRIGRDEALAKNAKLSLEAAERDGADFNIMLAGGAAMADEVIGQLIDVEAGLFLGSAVGRKLDKLLFDRYGLLRKQSAPSRGTVEFRTTAANPGAFTIPAGTSLQTADGVQFILQAAVTFPTSSTGPVLGSVRSVLAGANQQAKKSTITSIVSTISGAPADLRVTNALATSGAADAELDSAYRDRGRRFFLSARRGTLGAIEASALAVAGVVRATAFNVIDVLGRPARVVQLVVADEFTDALVEQNVNPPAYQTQSQQLAAAVALSMAETAAGGIYVDVRVAQVVLQPITLQLTFQAGANVDLVALIARATVAATVNNRSPGVTLTLDEIYAALRTVSGLQYTGQEIISPAGDVVPKALQVIRTNLNVVSVLSAAGGLLSTNANPDAVTVSGGGIVRGGMWAPH